MTDDPNNSTPVDPDLLARLSEFADHVEALVPAEATAAADTKKRQGLVLASDESVRATVTDTQRFTRRLAMATAAAAMVLLAGVWVSRGPDNREVVTADPDASTSFAQAANGTGSGIDEEVPLEPTSTTTPTATPDPDVDPVVTGGQMPSDNDNDDAAIPTAAVEDDSSPTSGEQQEASGDQPTPDAPTVTAEPTPTDVPGDDEPPEAGVTDEAIDESSDDSEDSDDAASDDADSDGEDSDDAGSDDAASETGLRELTLTVNTPWQIPVYAPGSLLAIRTLSGEQVYSHELVEGWDSVTINVPEGELEAGGVTFGPLNGDPDCTYTVPTVPIASSDTNAQVGIIGSCEAESSSGLRTVSVEIVAVGDAAPALEQFDGKEMVVYTEDSNLVTAVSLVNGTTSYDFEIDEDTAFSLVIGWQTPEDVWCLYDNVDGPGVYGADQTAVTVELKYRCVDRGEPEVPNEVNISANTPWPIPVYAADASVEVRATATGEQIGVLSLTEGWDTYTIEVPDGGLELGGEVFGPLNGDPDCVYTVPLLTVPDDATNAQLFFEGSCPSLTDDEPGARTVSVEIVAVGDAAPALEQFDGKEMVVYTEDSNLVTAVSLVNGTTSYDFEIDEDTAFSLVIGWQTPEDVWCLYDNVDGPDLYGADQTAVTVELKYRCINSG